MKLICIRLHPFGGTANRSCYLHDGVNVLEGPNEFGKSTLINALWNVLFTPTNLTPANLRKTMGRWYPKPHGDHAQVSLEFYAGGQKWMLQKTWGAGASSSLQADDAAGIADPATVQLQLNRLLIRNEATWRQVLFTGQAQLVATIEQLRAQHGEMDDVQPLLAGATTLSGDIPAEKLTAALETKISQHFGRWDQLTHRPASGKGIDDPWVKGVGPLLDAWYEMERTRRNLDEVRQHEKSVDEINLQIKSLVGEMSSDKDFILTGRSLRDQLATREGLEQRCQRLGAELKVLKQIMMEWPGAANVIDAKKSEQAGVESTLKSLEVELSASRKRLQASQLRSTYGLIVAAKNDWQTASKNLAKFKPVEAESLAELQRIEDEIHSARINLAAQKLTAKLESSNALFVTVQLGTEQPEEVGISPLTVWKNQADGIFRLDYQDLKVSVESGGGHVKDLLSALEKAQTRQAEILKSLGHQDLQAAKVADSEYKRCAAEEGEKKRIYTAALAGRGQEEWDADMTALSNLPETRSVEILETENRNFRDRRLLLEHQIRQEHEKVHSWTRDYGSLDSLTETILVKAAELAHATRELEALPKLPEGFTSISEYLYLLTRKEGEQNEREQALNNLKLSLASLHGVTPSSTTEELSIDLEIKEREFKRQREDGKALLRIQSRLQTILVESGTSNPLQGLADAISKHFRTLTSDCYNEVTLDGTAPATVEGTLKIEAKLLSQGTLGSLALATRLGLSELYLKDMEGFIALDDPFTDMDPYRRNAAARTIGVFGKQRQVLLFTCHPEHARELAEIAGAHSPIFK
jgi:exonuclease SbcC